VDIGFPLTAAPMNDPVLNAARKVVIKLAQTKIELPKNGAKTREATSCKPMLNMPRQNTKRNKKIDITQRQIGAELVDLRHSISDERAFGLNK
jgi:hypothetical protein